MTATSPAEWLAAGSLGLSAISLIKLALAFADADIAYFDPRPAVRQAAGAVRRAAESGRFVPLWLAAVDAGHSANWAAVSVRHAVRPTVVYVAAACRSFSRDVGLTLAALLILTIPTGDPS